MRSESMITFTKALSQHLESIRSIYNWYVQHTTVSFDIDPADFAKTTKLVFHEDERFPSYVMMSEEQVIGYVMLSPFIHKHGSSRTAEVTIYIQHGFEGRGYGKRALQFIEQQATILGFHTLIAVICTENDASTAVFTKSGYQLKGILEQVAFKFDRYLDASYYQKKLNGSMM